MGKGVDGNAGIICFELVCDMKEQHLALPD